MKNNINTKRKFQIINATLPQVLIQNITARVAYIAKMLATSPYVQHSSLPGTSSDRESLGTLTAFQKLITSRTNALWKGMKVN
jgi:hypothetical protein